VLNIALSIVQRDRKGPVGGHIEEKRKRMVHLVRKCSLSESVCIDLMTRSFQEQIVLLLEEFDEVA